MFTRTKTIKNDDHQTHFVLIYKEMRRIIHWFLKVIQKKEPNTFKDQFYSHMCINGYMFSSIKALKSVNKAFNFEQYLQILKNIRNQLVENGYDWSNIRAYKECYYSDCYEYILLAGCSDTEHDYSSILRKAINVITDRAQLENNDYRRIFMLQRILEANSQVMNCTDRGQDCYIYELQCFMPFIEYEFSKTNEADWDLNLLLGLMTNNYRDEN